MAITRNRSALALFAILTTIVGSLAFGYQQPGENARRKYMREKLELSKQILEGLTTEDYALVEKGAKRLDTLTQAALWRDAAIPNVDQYVAYTGEFRRLCGELDKQSKRKNIEAATLAYLQLTMNCVNCHKYVREGSK